MIFLKQIPQFLLTISLLVFIATTNVFGVMDDNGYASKLGVSSMNPPSNQIAWGERSKAVTKDIEGKTQEMMGNMTGDPKDRLMGKAKQMESKVRNKTEDIKDSMSLKGRAKAVSKNIEGKTQETIGNMTGNTQDQIMGKAKQAESQARNTIEDIKGN
ncbi:CsbD family protein [Geminocystis herdmanii]|uniref:CsbD family protein n=1 Tax=Geminocystis herdmanii TaxID=669359 RepID=UPI000347A89B|nr:CsbD family protein [Geminocystis herdmanii]